MSNDIMGPLDYSNAKSNTDVKRGKRASSFADNDLAMPIATAVWLIERTSLTFNQVANFCKLHVTEVTAIANETVAKNVIGVSPVGRYVELSEIRRCESDPNSQLRFMAHILSDLDIKKPKTRRYISVLQRRSRPDAVLWLLNFASDLSDKQISNLVGTTVATVDNIRNGKHRHIDVLVPKDPVVAGLCSQADLDNALAIANRNKGEASSSQK